MTQPIIDIKGLSLSYGHKRILTNIFLNLESGKTYGVIGPNGAGKSSLFKSILGLVPYSHGEIKVLGQEIEHVRKRIAYVPQKGNVDWGFPATVRDIVSMGRYPHLKLFDPFGKKDKAIINEALEQLGIADLANRQIGALSGGQQQRVFLARALAQNADLFFLDEPFVGVDVTTEEKIIEILKTITDKGKTVLVVHHDLSTVEVYFDQVILLNQRLIAKGPVSTVFTEENIKRTFSSQLPLLHKSGMTRKK
jgi:ABC-type Mn2+/Zn2+ transport system ATPase subunit